MVFLFYYWLSHFFVEHNRMLPVSAKKIWPLQLITLKIIMQDFKIFLVTN